MGGPAIAAVANRRRSDCRYSRTERSQADRLREQRRRRRPESPAHDKRFLAGRYHGGYRGMLAARPLHACEYRTADEFSGCRNVHGYDCRLRSQCHGRAADHRCHCPNWNRCAGESRLGACAGRFFADSFFDKQSRRCVGKCTFRAELAGSGGRRRRKLCIRFHVSNRRQHRRTGGRRLHRSVRYVEIYCRGGESHRSGRFEGHLVLAAGSRCFRCPGCVLWWCRK